MKGYCKECKRKVQGVKKKGRLFLNAIIVLVALFLFGIVGLILSIVLILFLSSVEFKNTCPICGLKISRRKE